MSDIEKSINASDLIDWIICAIPDWCVGDVREIVDHIEDMPSAQPKQKKGKWLRITNKDGSLSVYVCSLCNTKAHLIGYDAPSDYCHGCGAKMEVEG